MTILCFDNCHVWLGSSSLCTCEAHRVAMYGLPISYNPFSHHATPPTAADLPDVDVARLRSAERAGGGWLSADGLRIYCDRFGTILEAEWQGNEFGAWWACSEGLPADAVKME